MRETRYTHRRNGIFNIVCIYALFGILWIYTSDAVLGWIVHDPRIVTQISILKGSAFIILTSFLLYVLIRRYDTKLARSEQTLEANENYLRDILETEPECVKLLDADGNLLMMNRAGLDMIDADTLEQVKGKCVCPLVTESSRDAFIELNRQVFQGVPGTLQFEAIGLKGRHVWLETHAVPFRNENGDIVALLGITRDITEQIRSETLLRARIRLNKIATKTGLDDLIQAALDEAETLTGSNIGFFHFMDSDQNTLLLQAWSTNTLANMCRAEGKGKHYSVDMAGVWVDCVRERKPVIHNDYNSLSHKKGLPEGHSPIVRELVVPIIREGRIDAIIGVGNKAIDYTEQDAEMLTQFASTACDIAMRKKADRALKKSEDLLTDIIELSPISMAIVSMDGTIERINRRAIETFGYVPEDIPVMERWWMLAYPDESYRAEVIAQWTGLAGKAIAEKSEIERREYRVTCKDGTVKTALIFGIPVSDKIFVIFDDITDRKHAEEERLNLERQLLHSQKLESLGVLAGGIAHDFNNLLMAIIGNADLGLMRINKESPAVENLHRIEQAAERAADLARQMLAYSGKGKFVVENIDLNHLLEDMLHILEVSISKKAALRFDLHQDLPTVEADATQIRQIVMNLVINASEAIGEKNGVISITTGCMDCDRSYLKDVWQDENITDGLYVYLEITDTGSGMDKKTLSKIFDPFFTTKFTGRGLGMAAVLGIVRGHKGAIKVCSEPKKGTTFTLLLPASGKPSELYNGKSRQDDWSGSGTVLLVDDEDTVRGIGEEMLQELGFTTITASDGREAVETFKDNPDIAFVILDLTMPHMDGEQCFRELRQLKPDVKVILSSGFSEHEVTQKFEGKGLAGFIQKPYRLSTLKEAIQRYIGF
jgi:PAS domain S-box-containing protein